MNPTRIFNIILKDLKLGPRSPVFLWALVFPLVITLIMQVGFGSFFQSKPRLGIVDQGHSEISSSAAKVPGIDIRMIPSVSELKTQVTQNDMDAGLVLTKGFDQLVRSGQKPLLEFYISGQSLASNRLIIAVTAMDLIRQIQGAPALVDIQVNSIGAKDNLPMTSRMVPLIVFFILLIAGLFVPAFSLVEEREKRTLQAILVTPVSMLEILVAKAVLGLVLATLLAWATLLLNHATGPHPMALVFALLIAALMSVEIGLIFGTTAKDSKTLFTLTKTLNIILIAPVFFYLFPDWPQWIAKLFPTYWLIHPIFELAVKGAGLENVAFEFSIALIICALLIPIILGLSRRMQAGLTN